MLARLEMAERTRAVADYDAFAALRNTFAAVAQIGGMQRLELFFVSYR